MGPRDFPFSFFDWGERKREIRVPHRTGKAVGDRIWSRRKAAAAAVALRAASSGLANRTHTHAEVPEDEAPISREEVETAEVEAEGRIEPSPEEMEE